MTYLEKWVFRLIEIGLVIFIVSAFCEIIGYDVLHSMILQIVAYFTVVLSICCLLGSIILMFVEHYRSTWNM